MTAALDTIRAEIDALDAELRDRLLRRAQLVAEVAAAKTANGSAGAPLRPMREMQQMQALLAWQKAEAPSLSAAGLVAIWREIIGMALAQQGGVTICASDAAMASARTHFGASLDYQTASPELDELAKNPRLIAVLTLDEAVAPPDGVAVFARLPLIGQAQALCYGALDAETGEGNDADGAVALVRRAAAQAGDDIVFTGADYVLVETRAPEGDAVWGRYLTLAPDAGLTKKELTKKGLTKKGLTKKQETGA